MTDYGTLLRDHVTLRCRSIDRIFLQAYVPRLQTVGEVCTFLRWQRKFRFLLRLRLAKSAMQYVKAVYRFAEAHAYSRRALQERPKQRGNSSPLSGSGREGRQGSGRDDRDSTRESLGLEIMAEERAGEGPPSPYGLGPGDGLYQSLLFLSLGCGVGRGVLEDQSYAPYPIWLWLNGHEWAKRQLEKAGIGYEALDNGFRSCEDAAALQKICDRLGPAAVQSFFARWLRRLPSAFTEADRRAGYGYQMAFRQFEISDTCVFDRPQAGRMWFEGVIRDHLDVGRPDQIALIFHRRVNSSYSRNISYPSHQRGRRSHTVLLLQVFADQAVFQRGTGAAYRDSHL